MDTSKFRHDWNAVPVIFALLCMAMWSCNKYKDDVAEPKMVSHRLSLNMPLNINGATLGEGTAVLTNIQTGRKYTAEIGRAHV